MDLKLVFWELSPKNIYNKKGLQTGFPQSTWLQSVNKNCCLSHLSVSCISHFTVVYWIHIALISDTIYNMHSFIIFLIYKSLVLKRNKYFLHFTFYNNRLTHESSTKQEWTRVFEMQELAWISLPLLWRTIGFGYLSIVFEVRLKGNDNQEIPHTPDFYDFDKKDKTVKKFLNALEFVILKYV